MKITVLALLLAIIITGCGTGNKDAGQNTNGSGNGIVAGGMVPTLLEKSPLVYQYQVKNQTEEVVILEFTSSQRFDYSVETKNGEQLFLFSSVASFLTVLGEEEVKQGEELKYEIDLNDLKLSQGEYVLTAWMTPKDGKMYTVSKEFTIE
jgi:hypothetical protein